jgi:acyl carrier protein
LQEGFRLTAPGDTLKSDLKRLIIEELDLRDRTADDIDDDAPLFGEGLGLDSLDALQLAVAVEERFGVVIPEDESAKVIFASVTALTEHVRAARSRG